MTDEAHTYTVINEDKRCVYLGTSFEDARRRYESLSNGAMFATRYERATVTSIKSNGRAKILIH